MGRQGLAAVRCEEVLEICLANDGGGSMGMYLSKLLKLYTLNGCALLYINIVEK